MKSDDLSLQGFNVRFHAVEWLMAGGNSPSGHVLLLGSYHTVSRLVQSLLCILFLLPQSRKLKISKRVAYSDKKSNL